MDAQRIPKSRDKAPSVGGRIILGFSVIVALVIVSALISYYNTRQLYESARELLQSHEIQGGFGNVLSTMKDAETGIRGYIITGNKSFMEPYDSALASLPAQMDQLRALIGNRAIYQRDFVALEMKIQDRLALSKRVKRLRDEKGFEAAKQFVSQGAGKQAMDDIRILVEKMEATGRIGLVDRERRDADAYFLAFLASIVDPLVSLALIGLVFELVRRELAERRRFAETLHEERERFRVTLTSIGDAVIVTDAKGMVTFLNPVAGALTGWGQAAVGQFLSDVFRIVSERTQELVESPVTKVLREGAIVGLANHTQLLARGGGIIPIDDSGAPIRDRQNNIEGVVLVFRDITERRCAMRELEASEARYRMLFAASQDAILILDGSTGKIVDANPFAGSLLGRTHADLIGKELWQMGLPHQADENRAQFQRLQGQTTLRYDHLPLLGKDGKPIEVEFVISVYEVDRRRIVQCNIRDNTKHKKAEEVLREARDRYRSVVDHVIHGIIIIDEDGIIESVNPAAEQLFGYEAAELVGQKVKLLMPEPYPGEHDGDLADYLRTGEAKIIGIGREVVGRRKDGATFPIDLAVSQFQLEGRRLFTGIIRDITERKQFEEQLCQRAAQLLDADRRKNEFLAMLAHELRNPLAPIRNAVHLLRKNCPTDPQTRWAHEVIDRQVIHMARMVDDLLDVSRITRGKIKLQREPIEIAQAVTRAVEMAQPLVDERKQELTVMVPPESMRVDADLPRLAQVLANLLNNAAKYTEENGRIWLTVEAPRNEVLIKVRDTGIGIPADYLPRVFDLFSQEDSTLERTHGGLGIGLTLVRILIQMHGGSVQAFSAGVGRGSEFVVRLPRLMEDAPQPGRARPVAEDAGAKTPRRILVVDDNIDGARSLAMLLKLAGHEVQTAHDGVVALETARHWVPDIVLLDIGLPRMNGLEVARRMRDELGLKDALLIAMTGYGQDEDRQRSQQAGFNAHLIKPVDLDVLRTLLSASGSVQTGANA